MKNWLCLILLLGIILNINAQSYMGVVKKTANFREKPSMSASKIATLSKDAKLFVISRVETNDYYHVIDIDTNIEGYIYTSFVQIGKQIPVKESLFTQVGRTMSSETVIRIFNKSTKTVTLLLNGNEYQLQSGKKDVLKLDQGKYSFRVSAPGFIPQHGTQTIEGGYEYIWSFTGEQ